MATTAKARQNGNEQSRKLSREERKQERAQEKERRRERDRAEREADRERRERARWKTVGYDAQGRLIGDDGYLMTPARTRLHRLCDAFFFLMIATFLAAVACIGFSYFQGQQLTEWELIAYGGNEFHGLSVATMLRVEAFYLLFVTATCLFANMKGMAWLYDGFAVRPVRIVALVMGVVSAVYFIVAVGVAGIPEPVSLIVAVLAILLMRFVSSVEAERPTLKRPKVARTEVKRR